MATYRSKLEQIAEQISNYSPFKSRYDTTIDNYQNQVANFNNTNQNYKAAQDINKKLASGNYYDPETDRTYQQYKRSYIDNGQRAMDDTLGMVSARTGGLASSYAMTAANQTYNNYMKQLADKIPELENAARQRLTEDYSRYLGLSDKERSALQGLVDSYRGLRSDEYNQQYLPGYNKTKDSYSSYSTLENMAMQDEQLEWEKEKWAQEMALRQAEAQAAAAAAAARAASSRRSSSDDDEEEEFRRTTANVDSRQYGLAYSELQAGEAEGWFTRGSIRGYDSNGDPIYNYTPVYKQAYDKKGYRLNYKYNPYTGQRIYD